MSKEGGDAVRRKLDTISRTRRKVGEVGKDKMRTILADGQGNMSRMVEKQANGRFKAKGRGDGQHITAGVTRKRCARALFSPFSLGLFV